MLKLLAPAKLNICLDILKKTLTGYHEIQTIFVEYPGLADEIVISKAREDEILSNIQIPKEENLAYKALKLVKSALNIKKSIKIKIKKNIPISSGLGGASSDAAAVLNGLNEFWNLKFSQKKLIKLAENLGSDVPFFTAAMFSCDRALSSSSTSTPTPFTALGTHFGEKITKLKPITCVKFKLSDQKEWPIFPKNIDPKHKTGKMYEALDLSKCGKNIQKTKKLLEGIKKQDAVLIIKNIHNDFSYLFENTKANLSGSGPAVFTVHV